MAYTQTTIVSYFVKRHGEPDFYQITKVSIVRNLLTDRVNHNIVIVVIPTIYRNQGGLSRNQGALVGTRGP